MTHPPVVIVDDHDRVIGSMDLREVWKTGAYHRLTRVLIENSKGQVLLQHRSESVELWPGCWDVSSSGHVDEGTTYEAAARQEMSEELGLNGGELEEILYYKSNETYGDRKLNRFNKLYLLHTDETPTVLPPDEVSEVKWVTKDEMRELVIKHPDQASDGLRQTIEHMYGRVNTRSEARVTIQ